MSGNAFAITINPVRRENTDYRVVPKNVNPINARNPTARTYYECGSTDHFKEACPRSTQRTPRHGLHLTKLIALGSLDIICKEEGLLGLKDFKMILRVTTAQLVLLVVNTAGTKVNAAGLQLLEELLLTPWSIKGGPMALVDIQVLIVVKQLRRIRVPIVKVRWNSRQGPEFTWECEDQFRKKYPHLFTKTEPSSSTV
ncbi:hypothetical protein Tco_1464520 [Tanacetum coccineum]